jgi:hypothetical protein
MCHTYTDTSIKLNPEPLVYFMFLDLFAILPYKHTLFVTVTAVKIKSFRKIKYANRRVLVTVPLYCCIK